MGAATDYLRKNGLSAKANGKRIVVSPASKLTDDVRKFINAHRLELLAELGAMDGETRRMNWRVMRNGQLVCRMIGAPTTEAEALKIAKGMWPDAELMQ